MISEARNIELDNVRKTLLRIIEETKVDQLEAARFYDESLASMFGNLRVLDEAYKKESV